jgi:WD40 repeat protein
MKGAIFQHKGSILGVDFHPDGTTIATGSTDKSVRFWDRRSGQATGQVLEHPAWVEDVAFSPDGTMVVTCDAFDSARLWSLATGEQVGPPLKHAGPVNEVSFSHDGQSLLTAGGDGWAKLWQVPAASKRDKSHIDAWVEAITGMQMDDHGTLTPLDPSVWLQRRPQLSRLQLH